jgi:hypothetical protein
LSACIIGATFGAVGSGIGDLSPWRGLYTTDSLILDKEFDANPATGRVLRDSHSHAGFRRDLDDFSVENIEGARFRIPQPLTKMWSVEFYFTDHMAEAFDEHVQNGS